MSKDIFVIDDFKNFASETQLEILETLLKYSHADVKYNFQIKVEDITKYDIISSLPLEVTEHLLRYLNLNSLLKCRQVSKIWREKLHRCSSIWAPYLERYCINPNGFDQTDEEIRKIKRLVEKKLKLENLTVIGERLFNLSVQPSHSIADPLQEPPYDVHNNCSTYIKGRSILMNLQKHAGFHGLIDHDCRGSNVVMAMNDEIIAYAREDRHIAVKYANFPHKKIKVFQAHQCADMKLYGQYLITGGYDRLICVWHWASGALIETMEGSTKPVYSLDLIDDILYSTDGKYVISWNLCTFQMMIKTQVFNDDHVEELAVVDNQSCETLKVAHEIPLIVTRSSSDVKVWRCERNGHLTLLSTLPYDKPITCFHPFIRVFEDKVACSSEYGILVWSLVSYSLVKQLDKSVCHMCELSLTSVFQRTNNCRVILLFYSDLMVLQYFVHKNSFQFASTNPDSKVKVTWDMPSEDIWPWSHRKPGIASLVTNMEKGFSATSKISLFVATQGKKIYGMLFDASDFDYGFEGEIEKVEEHACSSMKINQSAVF